MVVDRITRRKKRISAKITGTNERPRISVYRSHKYVYVQAIDDGKKHTITSFSSRGTAKKDKITKSEEAKNVGKEVAQLLQKAKITTVVFDRGRYAYNGRVKQIAEGLREAGITV